MLVIVGASGCGKSTLAPPGRRAGDGDRRAHPARRPRHHPARPGGARHRHGVPELRAIPPYDGGRRTWPTACASAAWRRMRSATRVQQTADLLGLGALLARRPRQLSGGQRQRVAMGRAIVREPKLFLFDEPLSNLDAALRVQMRAEIRQLQRRLGVTSLYVTHDQVEAMTLGDRLLVLHQGVPVQFAPPMEIFERPATAYVAGFIGAPAMNFLPASRGCGWADRTPCLRPRGRAAAGRRTRDGGDARHPAGAYRPRARWPGDAGGSGGSRSAPRRWCTAILPTGPGLLVKQAGALPVGDTLSVAFPRRGTPPVRCGERATSGRPVAGRFKATRL